MISYEKCSSKYGIGIAIEEEGLYHVFAKGGVVDLLDPEELYLFPGSSRTVSPAKIESIVSRLNKM